MTNINQLILERKYLQSSISSSFQEIDYLFLCSPELQQGNTQNPIQTQSQALDRTHKNALFRLNKLKQELAKLETQVSQVPSTTEYIQEENNNKENIALLRQKHITLKAQYRSLNEYYFALRKYMYDQNEKINELENECVKIKDNITKAKLTSNITDEEQKIIQLDDEIESNSKTILNLDKELLKAKQQITINKVKINELQKLKQKRKNKSHSRLIASAKYTSEVLKRNYSSNKLSQSIDTGRKKRPFSKININFIGKNLRYDFGNVHVGKINDKSSGEKYQNEITISKYNNTNPIIPIDAEIPQYNHRFQLKPNFSGVISKSNINKENNEKIKEETNKVINDDNVMSQNKNNSQEENKLSWLNDGNINQGKQNAVSNREENKMKWLDEEIVEEKIESDNMNNKVEIVNIKPTNMRRRPFDTFEFPINNNKENNKDNENNINIT